MTETSRTLNESFVCKEEEKLIIEGAFLKIPEILLGYEDPEGLYEANITNLFTNGIVLELNARNIDNPLMKIQMEKRYNNSINTRCDIYLDFSSAIDETKLRQYGFCSKNWVEAKYFGGLFRNKGSETKSENAGSIIYDIYRTIKNTHDSSCFEDGKYSLNIFNDIPKNYLAFNRKDGSNRTWVETLVTTGISKLYFNLEDEPKTIKKLFKDKTNVEMKLKIKNTTFQPLLNIANNKGFYGYLIQIIDYDMVVDGCEYKYKLSSAII